MKPINRLKNPKFSIIIPVYNAEKYLVTCLESVLKQTYQNYEIILVNDGSTDSSYDIAKKFTEKHEFIKLYDQENQGASAARNNGIKVANGDYIIFLDSDDNWISNDFLKTSADLLENSQCDVLFFGYKKDVTPKENQNLHSGYYSHVKDKYVMNRLVKDKYISSSPCNKIIKRAFIIDHSLYFEVNRHAEDIEWNYSLLLYLNQFAVIPSTIYNYRTNPHSITAHISNTHYKDLEIIVNRLISNCGKLNLKDKPYIFSYVAHQYGVWLAHALCRDEIDHSKYVWLKDNKWLINYEKNINMKIFMRLYLLGNKLNYNKLLKNLICKRMGY